MARYVPEWQQRRINNSVNRLARTVEDLCHFGIPRGHDIYESKARMVVNIIFKVIAKELQANGRVTIENFGAFYVDRGYKLRKVVRFTACKGWRKELRDVHHDNE